MKKFYVLFFVVVLSALFLSPTYLKAQFVLTPSNGLVTQNGGYSIMRKSSMEDNLQTAMAAIRIVVPSVVIEPEANADNSFIASADATIKMGKKGAMALNHKGSYTLRIEATSETINLCFKELGEFRHPQGSVLWPWKPDEKTIINYYVFKYDGSPRHPKVKLAIENWANDLVRNIEQAVNNIGS